MALGYGTPNAYGLFLMSSQEIHDSAVKIFDSESLGLGQREDDNDPLQGPPDSTSKCKTCKLDMTGCPGHFAAIKLPIPISQPIAAPDLKALVAITCPNCSRIAIPSDARRKIIQSGPITMTTLKAWVSQKKEGFECPYCGKAFKPYHTIPIYAGGKVTDKIITGFSYNPIRIEKHARGKRVDYVGLQLVDNRDVWNMLTKIPAEDCVLCGFNPRHYHPNRFMTEYVPIAPPAARQRKPGAGPKFINRARRFHDRIRESSAQIAQKLGQTRMNALSAESATNIIQDIEILCIAIAFLQTQTPGAGYNALQQRLFSQPQDTLSYIASLAKKKGLLRKYVLGVRADSSARTVLSGLPYGAIGTVAYPKIFAMMTMVTETVTRNNIEFLRSLVRNGRNKYPGAVGFWRDGRYFTIYDIQSEAIASSLIPGDIVGRHMLPGDIVLHNRYPTLREESIDALIVKITDDPTISIPLATTDKKMADFDGDESQVFNPTTMAIAFEALLLQGNIKQFISPKNALPAIFGGNDAVTGIKALMSSGGLDRWEVNFLFREGYNTHDLWIPPDAKKKNFTGNDLVSMILPKNFHYTSNNLVIRYGHVVSGTFNAAAIKGEGAYLLKALADNVGSYKAILFLENITRFAYTINRIIGQSQAEDLRLSPAAYKKVRELIKARMQQIDDYSLRIHNGFARAPVGQDPEEYFDAVARYVKAESFALQISDTVINDLRGTSLERTGALTAREGELVNALATVGQILLDGKRPAMSLAHSSRSLVFWPRYLDNAKTRGYVADNYVDGMSSSAHFLEASEHRLQIFKKGVVVSKQGYFERRSSKNLVPLHVGYFGEIRGDADTIASFNYGHMNMDARSLTQTSLAEWFIPLSDFKKLYDAGIPEEYDELIRIRRKIYQDVVEYSRITSDIKFKADEFQYGSPIDMEYFIIGFSQKEYKKNMEYVPENSDSPFIIHNKIKYTKPAIAKDLWSVLRLLDQQFMDCHMRGNIGQFTRAIIADRVEAFKRVYKIKLCVKRLLEEQYSIELCRALCEALVAKYQANLVPAGDNVGLRAALSVTEPMTQGMLHAIRAAGGEKGALVKVERTHGIERLQELTSGSPQKNPITTVVLKGELKYDYMTNLEFTKRMNTIYLADLIYPSPLICSKEREGSPEDKQFLDEWQKTLPPAMKKQISQTTISIFKLKLNVSTAALLLNRTSLMDIQLAISRTYPTNIAYIATEHTMDSVTRVYVFFHAGIEQNVVRTICYEITTSLIVHGSGFFTNASVIEHKNNYYTDEHDNLKTRKSYRIEANGLNLKYVLSQPEVDPEYTFSNDINETIELYGIEEARGRIFEELLLEAAESSDLKSILQRHFRMYADHITYHGILMFITRHALLRNPRLDVLAKMSFEETHTFVRQAIREGRAIPIDAQIPRTLYGLEPRSGSGFSKILLDVESLGTGDKKQVISDIDKLIEGITVKKTKQKGGYFSAKIEHIPTFDDVIDEIEL